MFGRLKTINKLKREVAQLKTKVKELETELKQEKNRNQMLYKLAQGFDKARKGGK